MRIGIDARPLAIPTTGIGRYTTEIVDRWQSSNHDLYLYPHDTSRTHVLGSLSAQARFPRWIRRDKLDVFWSPRHHLPLLATVPTVVTIHDMVWRKLPGSMITLGRTLERLLMPPSLRKADAIIAVSHATRADIVEYLPGAASKTTVVHEAPFVFDRPTTQNDKAPTILFVGSFEPRKNIEGLLRAFASLLAQGIESHELVLAGNPGWKQDVPRMIREFGIQERVVQINSIESVELAKLYHECDFLVLPSFYEGFGLPIAEAMSFGKPIITSNLSSMPEVAGDAALLVDPYSVSDIANAMKRMITDRNLRDDLAAKAVIQAAKFSWDKAAEETLSVIERVGSNAIRAR